MLVISLLTPELDKVIHATKSKVRILYLLRLISDQINFIIVKLKAEI